MIVAGPGTAVDDAITLLGHKNIASGVAVAYPKYSLEEIIHQSPDVIFIGKGHTNMHKISATLLKKIKSVPAVRNNNVFYVSDSLYRLGPRVIQGIEELAVHLRIKVFYMNKKIIFIIGGARSGKSSFALAEAFRARGRKHTSPLRRRSMKK